MSTTATATTTATTTATPGVRVSVEETAGDRAATIRLVGSFDARGTASVREALHDQIACHDRVVVDLGEVHSVDLTALRVLAAASHQAGRSGHHVVLRGCGPAVRRLLHVSRLIRAVEVERAAVSA